MKMKEKISYKITPRNQPWRWGFRPLAQSDFGRSKKISFGESYRLIQITTITKRIPRQIQLTAFLRFVKVSSASYPACFERFSCTIPTTKKATAHIKRTMSIQTTIILFLQSRKLSTLRPVRKGSILRHRRSYWTRCSVHQSSISISNIPSCKYPFNHNPYFIKQTASCPS